MTTNPHAQWTPRPQSPPEPTTKKPKRWFMWTFLAVQALFIIWLATGIAAVSGGPEDCTGLDAQTCQDAHDAGAAIGAGLILAVWAAVDIVLGVTYGIVRLSRRR